MGRIALVHDVLDMQLCDRCGDRVGRVDALTLELRDGAPPRVLAILAGGPVRAERLGRWAIWLRRTLRRLVGLGGAGGTSRIPFAAVREIGETILLDVDGRHMAATHTERWLAEHVVCRVPGGAAGRERK